MSLGMAAAGLASLQNSQAQAVDAAKPWSVSASLRGFYDDNVNGVRNNKVESFGFEVSPSISLWLNPERTDIGLTYTFGYKWYEKEINSRDGHDDQTHTFAALLRHAFNERVSLTVRDSFVIGQEPDALRLENAATPTYQRISGDNIRNFGAVTLNLQVTRPFGIEMGYGNAFFDYDDDTGAFGVGNTLVPFSTPPANLNTVSYVLGSRSGLLDRMEHTAHIDGRWQLLPETVGIIGYQYGDVSYQERQPIGIYTDPALGTNVLVFSRDRNNRSHYGYLGLEHSFRPDLSGNVRAGVRYTEYYNSPDDDTSFSPYVLASLRWTYAKSSNLEFGVSHDRSATDQFSASGDSITLDSDSTVAYLSLRHALAPNLFVSAMGSFQYSTYNGGVLDGDADQYYTAGVDLEYRFNRHFSANVGYNYDKLESDGARPSFDRNRIYIGGTFVY